MARRPKGTYRNPFPYHAIIAGQEVMLDSDPQSGPAWIETKVPAFDPSTVISAQDRNYVQFPPELEFPYAQDDWSGGAGHADQQEGVRDTYWYAENADCSSGWPIVGPEMNTSPASVSGSVSQIIEFNGTIYAIADDRIYKRPDDVSAWTNITPGTDFAANVSGRCVVFQGTQSASFLFIPLGNSNNYYVMSTAEAFTQHASQKAVAFETVGNELWLAVKESNQWGVKKAEDGGTAATWGALTTVGDTNYAITRLMNVADRLLVHKTDGIFGVSIEAFTVDEHLTPELRGLAASTNGVTACAWNGTDVFVFNNNLMRYSPESGGLAQIGPELVERNNSPVKGPVVAIDGQAGLCLWAVIYNSVTGDSHLAKYGSWKSRNNSKTDDTGLDFRPVWHYSLYTWDSKHITTMYVSSGTYLATPQPRLWLGASDGSIYYMVLSRTANPLDDPNYRFNTASDGTIYLNRYTALFPFEDKLLKAVGIGGRELNGSSADITASYKTPTDSGYTLIGSVGADPGERVSISGNVAGKAFDMTLALGTTSNQATPILTHFVIYGALRTQNLKEIKARIVAGDNIKDLRGQPMRATWRDIRSNLESAMTTNGTFTVINPAGEEITVIGIDFGHGYSPAMDDSRRSPVWTETVRMVQTSVANNRGTWDRASAFTWSSLSAFTWANTAIL